MKVTLRRALTRLCAPVQLSTDGSGDIAFALADAINAGNDRAARGI
jgi:hypothetical protein